MTFGMSPDHTRRRPDAKPQAQALEPPMDDRGQHQIVPRDPLGQGLRDMVFQHVEPEAGFLVPGLLLGLFDQSERTAGDPGQLIERSR